MVCKGRAVLCFSSEEQTKRTKLCNIEWTKFLLRSSTTYIKTVPQKTHPQVLCNTSTIIKFKVNLTNAPIQGETTQIHWFYRTMMATALLSVVHCHTAWCSSHPKLQCTISYPQSCCILTVMLSICFYCWSGQVLLVVFTVFVITTFLVRCHCFCHSCRPHPVCFSSDNEYVRASHRHQRRDGVEGWAHLLVLLRMDVAHQAAQSATQWFISQTLG